jgi:23S rRNA (cytidine1920-2'-O)/16S rRNA (cytidine1409-2'-O)-methyltransferase
MARRRLDTLLTERGLFASRSRAAASVMAGEVRVGRGRRRAQKPGELIDVQEPVSVEERPTFVSRGGIKLANALAASGLDVAGRRALDVGASTGGFTDCLLQNGAREVIAVDVGYGTLAWSLRSDPRVRVLERTNARALTPGLLPAPLPLAQTQSGEQAQESAALESPPTKSTEQPAQPLPDLATIDVSFISLRKVLAPVLGCLAGSHDVLALIKPQFEVGRGLVGKGGVVRDPQQRRAALVAVGEAALELGAVVLAYHSSGLPGPKGNRETFIWLADGAGAARGASNASELEELAHASEREQAAREDAGREVQR